MEFTIKKRMAELTENIKENNMLKNQIMDIERKYGNLDGLDERIRVADLKESKIEGLLSKLEKAL